MSAEQILTTNIHEAETKVFESPALLMEILLGELAEENAERMFETLKAIEVSCSAKNWKYKPAGYSCNKGSRFKRWRCRRKRWAATKAYKACIQRWLDQQGMGDVA